MEKYKKLIRNSGILLLGNFGSKVLIFLLVPLYTYSLTIEQYGQADIITTSVSLIVPLITFSISEASLRFAMDNKDDSGIVLSNSLTMVCIGGLIGTCVFSIIYFAQTNREYLLITYVLLLASSVHVVISQYCRGVGKVKEYSIGGVISTLVLVVLNILFLVYLKLGVQGYLLAILISYIVPTIYYSISINLIASICQPNWNVLKQMLFYSIPLIPNALSWWAMQAIDKYILIYDCGVEQNGLYVVSQKIPSIITVISGIIIQAWQLSAVEEKNYENKNMFYSVVFQYFSCILFIITSVIMIFLKPLFAIWVANDYYEAWKYTPILLLANIFSNFSVFIGVNYMAMRKTKGNLKTNMIGCIINIILNYIFIPYFGIYAAAGATLFSFLVTWIIRVIDTKDYVKIDIKPYRIIISLLCIATQYVALLLNSHFFIQTSIFFIMIFLYKKEIYTVIKQIIVQKKFYEKRRND